MRECAARDSAQLKPLLRRLRRLIEHAPANTSVSGVATWLELRPRRPTDRIALSGASRARACGAARRLGGLAYRSTSFCILHEMPAGAAILILASPDIGGDPGFVVRSLETILGPSEIQRSSRERGWWVSHPLRWAAGAALTITFEEPSRSEQRTLFGSAM